MHNSRDWHTTLVSHTQMTQLVTMIEFQASVKQYRFMMEADEITKIINAAEYINQSPNATVYITVSTLDWYIHFGECNPFLIAEFLKVDSRDPWVPLGIQRYALQACNCTVYKWNQMDPDGSRTIWFHLYTVRVKRRPWNVRVWEPLPYFSS